MEKTNRKPTAEDRIAAVRIDEFEKVEGEIYELMIKSYQENPFEPINEKELELMALIQILGDKGLVDYKEIRKGVRDHLKFKLELTGKRKVK